MLSIFLLCLFFLKTIECYLTSECLGRNQEFSFCTWKCPPTCVNLQMLSKKIDLCSYGWDCTVGCHCIAGYVKDEYTKLCVLPENCTVSLWNIEATMQFLVLSVLVSACMVAAVPLNLKEKESEATKTSSVEGHTSKRDKRSHLGGASYSQANSYAGSTYNAGNSYQAAPPAYIGAPCASAPIAIAPAGPYPGAIAAHGGYGYPSHIPSYGGGYPQYRSDDQLFDDMSFAENQPGMDHIPMSRSYGGYEILPAASHIAPSYGAGAYGAAGSYGSAVGVFPNANVGGCAIPLLLSCSPSVQAGKIVRQSHYAAPAGYGSVALAAGPAAVAGGYRDVDDHELAQHQHSHHEDLHHEDEIPAAREQLSMPSEKHNDK